MLRNKQIYGRLETSDVTGRAANDVLLCCVVAMQVSPSLT